MTGAARPVVCMGVSASGKSSLGRALAGALGCTFVEGDDLHPPANVARMRAGIPLTDADRAPWLDAVAAALALSDGWVVASCSALKRAYRDRLRAAAPRTAFLLLDAAEETLARRIAARTGHFMPPSLLASQLVTLEHPALGECAHTLDAARPPGDLLADALGWLRGLAD